MTAIGAAGQRILHGRTPGVSYVRAAGGTHDVRNRAAALVDFVEVELLAGGQSEQT